MSEHDKKEYLGGDVIITPSSDKAIEASLNEIRRGLAGLPDPEIIIEGQSLPPKTSVATLVQESSNPRVRAKVVPISSLPPNCSAVGYSIQSMRDRKIIEKKAA